MFGERKNINFVKFTINKEKKIFEIQEKSALKSNLFDLEENQIKFFTMVLTNSKNQIAFIFSEENSRNLSIRTFSL